MHSMNGTISSDLELPLATPNHPIFAIIVSPFVETSNLGDRLIIASASPLMTKLP